MSRDPAVRALHAVHLSTEEAALVSAGQPIVRPTWPPLRCQGTIVGLCVGATVAGEATLEQVVSTSDGAAWHFGQVTIYAHPLPLTARRRGMASPMPPAPLGTLTAPREAAFEW